MSPRAFVIIVAYGAFIGWSIRKLELDTKTARAIKAGTTEFIAYAKAVPPADTGVRVLP